MNVAKKSGVALMVGAALALSGAADADDGKPVKMVKKPFTPEKTVQPMKSWINVFTHAGQWSGKPHVDIFGIIQPTARGGEGAIDEEFGFTRARLGVRGTMTEDISYWALYELGRNGVTAPTNGGARLLDAQINWRASDWANLRMGQFIPDFATAITPGAVVHWVDYTDIEKSVYFFNRNGDTETNALRELGVSVWNEFRSGQSSFTYEIGAYNGRGLTGNDTDDDKDIIASAQYGYGPWWVHGGYWTGDREVGGRDLSKDKWSLAAGWGNYVKDKYWAYAEYLETDEEQGGGAPDVEADGFYVAAGFKPSKKTHLTYRYSECDCGDNVGPPGPRDSEVHTFTAEYFIKGNMKLLAQYDVRDDDLGTDDNAYWLYLSMPFSYRLTP